MSTQPGSPPESVTAGNEEVFDGPASIDDEDNPQPVAQEEEDDDPALLGGEEEEDFPDEEGSS